MTEQQRQKEAYTLLPKMYKSISLALSVIFAAAGILFLFIPDSIVVFFNTLSPVFGLPASPIQATGLYVVLAVGYMYLVTLLAYLMYRHPEDPYFPLLLINGKSASSIISFLLFVLHKPYLMFIANCIVDGIIAAGVWALYRKMKVALR
jgi:hypothetical protein